MISKFQKSLRGTKQSNFSGIDLTIFKKLLNLNMKQNLTFEIFFKIFFDLEIHYLEA